MAALTGGASGLVDPDGLGGMAKLLTGIEDLNLALDPEGRDHIVYTRASGPDHRARDLWLARRCP